MHGFVRAGAVALGCTLVLFSVTPARADAERCRAAVSANASALLRAAVKARGKCEDRVLSGSLPPSSDCSAHADVTDAVADATAKIAGRIDKACGGDDRSCGSGGDDESLASIGWDAGVCPDAVGLGCSNAIADCGDIVDCVACMATGAAGAAATLAYGSLDTGAGGSVAKCQRTLGRETSKLLDKRSKTLAKCWRKVSGGAGAAPCPSPGDGKTAAKLDKAENKAIAKICKACGGGDRACDDTVSSVAGSGGADDLLAASIGFAATCSDLTVPGTTGSCSETIDDASDVVRCLDCVARFHGDCVDLAASPWGASYPAVCNGGEPPACGVVVYDEDFTGDDGPAWPSPWVESGSVDVADVVGGRARFRPTLSGYSLARLAQLSLDETDVEVLFTVEFEDVDTQGVGFYVRSNGGYLDQTNPAGQGYAVFIESFDPSGDAIGLWKEVDGHEIPILRPFDPTLGLADDTSYRVRFRVSQQSPTQTRLRARIWPVGDAEPTEWNVEVTDDEPVLQNLSGGLVLDSWSSYNGGGPTPEHTLVDDIVVTTLCNPLAGVTGVDTIAETFTFLEGPRWRAADGVLLFTDVATETIHELTPPSSLAVFRASSNGANGLANDVGGELLACEHASRSVTTTDGAGVVTTLVDEYLGMAFNSPNDIAVRSDGTVYFTDPHYGLPGPREIPFNGLFRRTPAGALSAEFMGDAVNNGPNGVDLSPDESVLYLADSETGEVTRWDVAGDGSLSGQSTFATGLTIPDGMCIDGDGNVFVATWASTVEVFAADGDYWGAIDIPRQASNCAFGGPDGRTLYVTAHEGLYSVTVPIAGIY